MTTQQARLAGLRTRWSAIGAAIAITLGAGGIGLAQAAVDSGEKPITVTVDSKRILDTRINLGLAGGFAKDTPREVQVTGPVTVATASGTATETVVPAGASAVLVNVTVVFPTDQGFLTLRAGGAAGAPSTSTVNFQAGTVEPNAATVDLSADGKVQVWVFMPSAAAKADVLIDVVGYTVDHNHDDRYYTETEADAVHATKANSADVYTKAEIDSAGLWAVVEANATLSRGSNVVSVAATPVFGYGVVFNRNVSQCAFVATVGNSGAGNPSSRFAAVASLSSDPNGVFVRVFDDTGADVNHAFHLIVQC